MPRIKIDIHSYGFLKTLQNALKDTYNYKFTYSEIIAILQEYFFEIRHNEEKKIVNKIIEYVEDNKKSK